MLLLRNSVIVVLIALIMSSCDADANASSPATLNISTYYGDTMDGSLIPAGGGASVYINNEKVGKTSEDGTLSLEVDAGETTIRTIGSGGASEETVLVLEGQVLDISLIVDSKYLRVPSELSISSIDSNRILPGDFTDFVIQITGRYGHVTPIDFDYFDIAPADDLDDRVEITAWLKQLPNGDIAVEDIESLRAALRGIGEGKELQLTIYAEDETGNVYDATYAFYLGEYSVTGQLAAPPSNPTLYVGDLTVTATYLGDDEMVIQQQADSSGFFTFDYLIPGNWQFTVTTNDGETVYTCSAGITVNTNKQATLNVLANEDRLNGVPNYEWTDISLPLREYDIDRAEERAKRSADQQD